MLEFLIGYHSLQAKHSKTPLFFLRLKSFSPPPPPLISRGNTAVFFWVIWTIWCDWLVLPNVLDIGDGRKLPKRCRNQMVEMCFSDWYDVDLL